MSKDTITSKGFSNSLGMNMIPIPTGSFTMGQDTGGDPDEKPCRTVEISHPFYMAATVVTNTQYEAFMQSHKDLRGIFPSEGPIDPGLTNRKQIQYSLLDDEAVLMVTWKDAVEFCNWLSEKEGILYRLPTEAEWEYACRAGTATPFNTGPTLPAEYHRRQLCHNRDFSYGNVSLLVGQTHPNAFNLYDMHGLVEEWCSDWYAPYPDDKGITINPSGPETGYSQIWAKVTRGGSHHTDAHDLRSASRMGAHPDSRSWFIGFRVIADPLAQYKTSDKILAVCDEKTPAKQLKNQSNEAIIQDTWNWRGFPMIKDMTSPYFASPIAFVKQPLDKSTAFFPHNHCPAITYCENGDILACWFSTEDERGRGMVILSSRLRAGTDEWEPASLFYDIPDRNPTGSALWHDGNGRLLHLNSITPAGTWSDCIIIVRESRDNGATWSASRLLTPDHRKGHRLVAGPIQTSKSNVLFQPCDAGDQPATRLLVSEDNGKTWYFYEASELPEHFCESTTGPVLAGIHGAVAESSDGSTIIGVGRDTSILGKLPISYSINNGKDWTYKPTPFPPIGTGQRNVLLRTLEGSLLLISFSHTFPKDSDGWEDYEREGIEIADEVGLMSVNYGLFASISYDDGKSWPICKLITDERKDPTYLETGDSAKNLKGFWIDRNHAEHAGYLAATQTPDGTFHLISSHWYYRFNTAWLLSPMKGIHS